MKVIHLILFILTVINCGFAKKTNFVPVKKTGHWSTCPPVPDCECPPIGCFRGGSQCAPTTTCYCPCENLAGGISLKSLNESEIRELATKFAKARVLDGTTDEEGLNELIDFTIGVIKAAK